MLIVFTLACANTEGSSDPDFILVNAKSQPTNIKGITTAICK